MANRFKEAIRTFRAVNHSHGFRFIVSRHASGSEPVKKGAPPGYPEPGELEPAKQPGQKKPGEMVQSPTGPAGQPAPDQTRCALYLYDAIGSDLFGDGITAKGVTAALAEASAAGAKALDIYINSPGGDVFESTAVYTALSRFKGSKTVYVDGIAASAASYIAMVGDTIITAPNALWMIHDPWGFAMGNAADMREAANLLDKVAGTMLAVYCERTEQPELNVQQWMAAETWMTAREALARGFTDLVQRADIPYQDENELQLDDPEPDPNDPNEPDEDENEIVPNQKQADARRTAVLSKFTKVPQRLRPDVRALIASMEARASPRATPRIGTKKTKH